MEPSSPLAREVLADLCRMLPPHPDHTPEAQAMRNELAMEAVAALHPADAFEAKLAARVVGMDAQAAECLRLAGLAAADDPGKASRHRAQAIAMTRQSDVALRMLLRMRATRDKQLAELHPAAMERAGYWFREVPVPPAAPAPAPAPAEHEPPDVDAEVALYEAVYPERAARIRAAGGLPTPLDFGPPEPHIVAGLLRRPPAASHAA